MTGAGSDLETLMARARAAMQAGRESDALAAMEGAALTGAARPNLIAGLWRLAGYGGPVDFGAATRLLARAAAGGEAKAQTMLATLAVCDVNGARDWPGALTSLSTAAAAGDARAICALAFLVDRGRDARRALLACAAARGEPAAQYAHARALLDRGDEDSRAAAASFMSLASQQGDAAAQRWLGANARPAAPVSPPSADKESGRVPDALIADALGAVRWPHERALPAPVRHRDAQEIVSYPGLFAQDECDYLISRGAGLLRPARVGGTGGTSLASARRTNSAMKFGVIETDPFIQSLDSLVARALGEPAENGERFALLRYRPGEAYAPHCDWIDPTDKGKAEGIARWGQRIKTFLVYLNADYEGAETQFPRLDWRFRGGAGEGIAWRNVKPDGTPDPMTLHAGLPPQSGEKWLLSKWMRDRNQSENYA